MKIASLETLANAAWMLYEDLFYQTLTYALEKLSHVFYSSMQMRSCEFPRVGSIKLIFILPYFCIFLYLILP